MVIFVRCNHFIVNDVIFMRFFVWFALLMSSTLFLSACRQTEPISPATDSPADTVNVRYGGVDIAIGKPHGWLAYPEETHLILSETTNPFLADGRLDGIVLNLWTQQVAPDDVRESMDEMLTRIVRAPNMRSTSATTNPTPFSWDGFETAYYLLNSGDGNVTLVMALQVDNNNQILGINASAPVQDIARLRDSLPDLLDNLRINDEAVTGASLHEALPVAFTLPPYNPNPEAAMEASPEQAPTDAGD
jgi:hypothetical protein